MQDASAPELPADVSVVVVTKGPGSVDPAEVERAALGVDRVPVVMSDQAWDDYRVLGYPFFVLIDSRDGKVIGETVGFGWSDVASMVEAVPALTARVRRRSTTDQGVLVSGTARAAPGRS